MSFIVKAKKYYFITILKFLFLFAIIFYFSLYFQKNHITELEIPELINYQNQTLKLLVPSKKCHELSPRTLYFESNYRNKSKNENENIDINLVNLNETYKKYYVTYYIEPFTNYDNYLDILKNHGIIRSIFKFHNHNLFINAFNAMSYKTIKKKFIK